MPGRARPARALLEDGDDIRGIAHVTGGGLPGNVPRALPATLGARLDPSSWPLPSVMRLMGALGGLEDDELRATFNGGLGMVLVVPPTAAGRVVDLARDRGLGGLDRRDGDRVAARSVVDATRRRERSLSEAVSGRVAVGVSGAGRNLRALVAAANRGALGGEVTLVFADRACAALDWAAEQGIETVLVPGGDDATLAETLAAVAPDAVVLAGYLRIVGPQSCPGSAGGS